LATWTKDPVNKPLRTTKINKMVRIKTEWIDEYLEQFEEMPDIDVKKIVGG